jgi:hypothetical protein
MGLEMRDGRLYYYRKRRTGGRVVSEYAGAGRFAAGMAQLDAEDREEAARRREAERRTIEAMRSEDAALDSLSEMVESVTRAACVVAGFHRHKGQWRLIRGGKK